MAQDAWNPNQYDKFKAERSLPFYDLMKLLQPAPAGARMVDLGCGTGELTADLHRHVGATETIGLDSSHEMLLKARTINLPGLSFDQQAIETWKDPAGVDILFSNAALQWCESHDELFHQLRAQLRPGGQLAVQMPMNHDYPTHLIAKEMSIEEPWASRLQGSGYESSMLTAEEYATLLFRLGFKEQKVFVRVYGHVLDSREGVIEWVKGTLLTRFKSQLSEKDYQDFLTDFKNRLFKTLPDDKPFFYPFKRILMWAKL